MQTMLREVEAAIKAVTTWVEVPMPESPDPTSKAFSGMGEQWKILVVDYAAEGDRAQMGTATKPPTTVLVLTPELAKLARDRVWPDVCPECLKRSDENIPLREECKEHRRTT